MRFLQCVLPSKEMHHRFRMINMIVTSCLAGGINKLV